MSGTAATDARFPLRSGPDIELDAAGFVHPGTASSRQAGFTRYRDVTHVAASERGVWIASEDDLLVVPREHFEQPDDATRLACVVSGVRGHLIEDHAAARGLLADQPSVFGELVVDAV